MRKLLPGLTVLVVLISAAHAADGLIAVPSNNSVEQTLEQLESVLIEKGMTIVARVSHSDNALRTGKTLPTTELLIFSNPKMGTPLIECGQSIAIDLPQKVLVWKDADGKVWLGYNDPEYLKARHQLSACNEEIERIKRALATFAETATRAQ